MMTPETVGWRDLLVVVTALAGLVLILVAAVGLVRLPDVFCRSHALGKAMTLGLSLVLVALWIHLGFEEAGLVLPLALFFQFLTIPVAGHLLCRLGYRKNYPRWKG